MFYVACYFRTLVHMFKEIELIERNANINPLEIKIEDYQKIFENSNVAIFLTSPLALMNSQENHLPLDDFTILTNSCVLGSDLLSTRIDTVLFMSNSFICKIR